MTFNRFISAIILIFTLTQTTYAARHFIIDTDMGGDDVIGILYILQRHDIQVDAITIVGNGEAHCKPALHNLRGLMQLMKHTDIPLACDSETPLSGQHHFPAVLTNDQEQLSGANALLPIVHDTPSSISGVDLLIKTLAHSREPVEILALGPLTNIAKALQRAPQIQSHIKMIYISGGAVHTTGNIQNIDALSANKTAEWNMYIDPVAADSVFKHNLPITLIPLDVTHQIPLHVSFVTRLANTKQSRAAEFVYALLKANMKWIRADKFYFWDPLAAAIASDNSLATFENLPLHIAVGEDSVAGTTMVNKINGRPVSVAIAADKIRFKHLLLAQLNQPFSG